MLLALFIAALLLSIAASGDGQLPLDATLAQYLQRIDWVGILSAAQFVNWIGYRSFAIAAATVIGIILICIGRPGMALLVGACVAARATNSLLKALVDSPRPPAELINVHEITRESGFPSGHVMGSVLFYGSLIYVLRRLAPFPGSQLIQLWAAAIIVAMSFSRVYVGAHWPSDVLGGYLWGGCCYWLSLPRTRSGVDAANTGRGSPADRCRLRDGESHRRGCGSGYRAADGLHRRRHITVAARP
jgi:undecaprenyl-diphosphatase